MWQLPLCSLGTRSISLTMGIPASPHSSRLFGYSEFGVGYIHTRGREPGTVN